MHSKYGKDGLDVVAVTLDDPRDTRTRDKVIAFLRDKVKATFTNVNLDPKSADWEKKLRTNGVPCIFVFNRDNQYVKKLPVLDDKGEEKEEVDYDVIEKTVANLMKK
jgi:prolyl-tRNA synthetase